MNERKTVSYWLLITALNTAKYAIAELEPSGMKFQHKHQFTMLHNAIHGFLATMQQKTSKQDKEFLNSQSFENVAALVETFSMIAQIPEPQIEWFLNETNKLVYASVNNERLKSK
jgi:hypothetical protein